MELGRPLTHVPHDNAVVHPYDSPAPGSVAGHHLPELVFQARPATAIR